MHITRNTRPDWTTADRVIDITDIWQEMMDPANERGEVCTAYLHRDRPGDELERFELRGIGIEDGGATAWMDREKALYTLGSASVWRAEELEWQSTGNDRADW